VRVLHVVDGILLAPLRGEVHVDLDRLIVSAREEVPACRVDPDLVDEVGEEDNVAAALRHRRRLAASRQVDELVDEHLDRLARVPEHLGEGREAPDVAVMVRAEHVDEPVEAARELPADVRGVGREVGRRPVRANHHAVAVVAVRGRLRPEGALRLEGLDRLESGRDLRLE
jgi:hypothetical protein